MSPFDDPAVVAAYRDGPPRKTPGFVDLQRMARMLLAETASANGEILVLGAGGGLELKAFAEAQAGWTFVGVDPSAAMLDLASQVLGPLRDRVSLIEGYIDAAPPGPFDAACCLLTLHFVAQAERLCTLKAIRARMKPGAALVVAHHSIPDGPARPRWLSRYAAYSAEHGADLSKAQAGARTMGEILPILTPETDEQLLREAGFSEPELFYAGFTFRGWVARA